MTISHTETKAFIDMAGPSGPKLVQLPGLDGLRGVAVAAVVLYHMGFEWMVGGFLGVSTFFTLSGFLITSILLNESIRSDRPSLGRFWSRRFRRLMPAALLTLLAIALLFGRTLATADQRLGMRGDVLSSLFYVANWRFIFAGSTYGDFTGSPSPVLHFWSLSIEEQFYVVFPLLIWGLWRLARRHRLALGVALAALVALCSLLPWAADMSTNRAYLGSDVRAGEILLGGVLAIVLSSARLRRTLAIRYQARTPLLVLAAICGVVQMYWFVTVEQSSTWLYRGGLTLFAAMTCVLITAAALPVGAFRIFFGSAPMRWIGTRSYGIYLFHWPLLVAARQAWPDMNRTVRGSLAVVVALVAAEASFRFVESPVRLGRWPVRRRALATAVSSFGVVALLAAVPIPVDRERLPTDFESATEQLETLRRGVEPSTSTATSTTVKPTPVAVPRVSIFGDSTSVLAALGLATSVRDGGTTQLAYSGGDADVGCGISRFARNRLLEAAPLDPKCLNWPDRWAAAVTDGSPDVSMVITGAWEITDVQLPNSTEWTSIGNPQADDFIRSELTASLDVTSGAGALTIFWLWPPFAPWSDDMGRAAVVRQHETARMERLHQLIDEVVEANPHRARVFDLSEFLGPDRLGDRSMRPDGLHVPAKKLEELFTGGLSQRIHDIYTEWWYSEHQ